MTGLAFRKAERRARRASMSIAGPTGSGKTLAALAWAWHVAGGKRFAVVDTENESAALYADHPLLLQICGPTFGFDSLDIRPPYLTAKYQEALELAIQEGYPALVIDSLSHQWDGDGGILQRKEQADTVPGSNHWTNWAPFTKEYNAFRDALLNCPIHLVACMRSKMAYQQTQEGSKKKVEKLGLQPIQRDGLEYEFTLAFDVGMDHRADTSKDRTGRFAGERWDLLEPAVIRRYVEWLDSSAEPLATPADIRRLKLAARDAGVETAEQYRALLRGSIGKEEPDTLPEVEQAIGLAKRVRDLGLDFDAALDQVASPDGTVRERVQRTLDANPQAPAPAGQPSLLPEEG